SLSAPARQPRVAESELIRTQPVAVEALDRVDHRVIAARADVGDDRRDALLQLRALRRAALLERAKALGERCVARVEERELERGGQDATPPRGGCGRRAPRSWLRSARSRDRCGRRAARASGPTQPSR